MEPRTNARPPAVDETVTYGCAVQFETATPLSAYAQERFNELGVVVTDGPIAGIEGSFRYVWHHSRKVLASLADVTSEAMRDVQRIAGLDGTRARLRGVRVSIVPEVGRLGGDPAQTRSGGDRPINGEVPR